MSAEVEKFSIYDDRVVQTRPKFAVDKGGLSVTNAPFNAITQSASQMVFNVNVPSPNVFLDRAVDWTADTFLQFTVTVPAPAGPDVNKPVFVFGRDGALAPMPLHQITTTLVATINDANVTLNCSDTINEILRLTDLKKNRMTSTAPRMLDKYGSYNDAFGAVNNTLAGYTDATDYDNVGNGAYNRIDFTDGAGNVLVGSGSYVSGPTTVNYINGVPVLTLAQTGYPIFIKFRSTEKITLSPFIFSEIHEYETGLYGISNIQFLANIGQPNRVLRTTTQGGRTVSAIQFNQQISSPFQNARLNCIFLTPPLSLSLPPRSIVPYMEYPRYISSQYDSLASGASTILQSQNIVLPVIPDMLLVYVKPSSYADSTVADFHLPISSISLNFNNFSGLMNTYTTEQLFHASVSNGLDMDWDSWTGEAVSTKGGGDVLVQGSGYKQKIQTVGGFLVIKPSKEFALQEGLAPNVLGNFNLQFSVGVKNTSASAVTPVLYVITVNSGFFESQNGSSRIIRGILDERSVLEAPMAPSVTRSGLARMVGAGFFDKLGSVLSKAKEIYSATKPLVSGVKGMLPEGKIRSALGAVGYGLAGAGEEMEGGMMHKQKGGRKGVASRLME